MKILLILAATLFFASCSMQRAYTVNMDKHGNITGGITLTPVHQAK